MTDSKSTFTRRAFIAVALASPVAALAHEGHGANHVTATATVLRRKKTRLDLALTFFNKGSELVTLQAISVEGATLSKQKLPFEIAAGALEEQKLTLRFADAIPGIFTMVLDFGADGQGPVVVMP